MFLYYYTALVTRILMLVKCQIKKNYTRVRLILESKKKVPNGSKEATKPIHPSFNDILYLYINRPKNAQNITKSTPCIQPTTCTASGMPAIYLSGIAMPNKISKDIPSNKAMNRNWLIFLCCDSFTILGLRHF